MLVHFGPVTVSGPNIQDNCYVVRGFTRKAAAEREHFTAENLLNWWNLGPESGSEGVSQHEQRSLCATS